MKSRQKSSVSEKNLLKSFSGDAAYDLDLRTNKKISSNPLIQKNIQFLQKYNKLLKRASCGHIEDAERYFKETLRNEPFDLIRDLRLGNLVRSTRSFESVNQVTQRRPRSRRTVLYHKKFIEASSEAETEPQLLEDEGLRLNDLFTPELKDTSDTGSESGDNEPVLEKVEEILEEETVVAEDLEDRDETPRPDIDKINDRLDHILKGIREEEINDMGEEFDEEYEMGGEEFAGFPDDEDDEMKEVEKMIERASQELAQVADENRKIMETLDEADEMEDKSEFHYNPAIDSAVMKELEEAECQAKATAKIIAELKAQVIELSKKETMTEQEAKELEQKNMELKKQMIIFEQKTKRIQELIAQTNLFENLGSFKPTRYNEDVLPKVVVCGMSENQMPKILICDDNKSKCKSDRKKTPPKSPEKIPCDCSTPTSPSVTYPAAGPYPPPPMPDFFNQQLQRMGPGLQNTCECHQPQMGQPMGGMMPQPTCSPVMMPQPTSPAMMPPQMIPSPPPFGNSLDYCECDNATKDISRPKTRSGPSPGAGMPCGKGRGVCPAEIESRLQEYSENTQFLEKQLYDMEAEVKEMHQELLAVQKEREHLEHHKKMLCPPLPCGYPPCPSSPCPASPCPAAPCPPPPCGPPCETQLRELREQYRRLQDDFKSKLTEVAGLRTENEKLKDKTKLAEDAKKEAEKQVRELELEIKRIKGTLKGPKQISKEQVIELEQQLTVAKQRFREAQDELDELRLLVEDQQKQLDDYRNKYLEAQQQVEEQRRQIDLMEMENQRISEQVNLEIQRVKNQFQEKLQELMPLPDILKSTQMKLQEAQQMHLLAERNNESIARELQMYKDKIAAMTNQIDEVRSDQQFGEDAKAVLEAKVKELEEQLAEIQDLNSQLLIDLEKLNEKCDEYEKLADERLHEIVQLEAQLESLREETARQVSRIKDRCEIVRRSMQKQISDLERQLAQSRALAKSAQKDRDEIRQKMQAQINNLNENFEDAQMRIRNLQGHVNFLRNSYGDVYGGDNNNTACKPPVLPDPCDCNPAY